MKWVVTKKVIGKDEIIDIVKRAIETDSRIKHEYEKSTNRDSIEYTYAIDGVNRYGTIFINVGTSIVEFTEFRSSGTHSLVFDKTEITTDKVMEIINGSYYVTLREYFSKYEKVCKEVKELMDKIPSDHRRYVL